MPGNGMEIAAQRAADGARALQDDIVGISVSVRPGSALDFYARLSPVNALMVRMLAVRNTAAMKKLLAQFDAVDQQTDETQLFDAAFKFMKPQRYWLARRLRRRAHTLKTIWVSLFCHLLD